MFSIFRLHGLEKGEMYQKQLTEQIIKVPQNVHHILLTLSSTIMYYNKFTENDKNGCRKTLQSMEKKYINGRQSIMFDYVITSL